MRLFVALLFNFWDPNHPSLAAGHSQHMYHYIPLNENYPFNSSHPLPHYTVTVNGLIKCASSTQLEGRNDESLLEPLWVFFPIHLSLAHFWKLLPVPLCLNYLAMPSWDAIIQTLIPRNFHTSVCTLTCLMFTITYVGASSISLRIRDTGAHIGWRKEGFYPLWAWYTAEVKHFIFTSLFLTW